MIVAIPSDKEHVWKISSEKVPHLTLCYLGDQVDDDALIRMTQYLSHVVETSMKPFGLSVKRRGVLGPRQADVLFFDESSTEKLRDVRSYLLANKDIFDAYNSTDQYDKWLPHLTLGFPETPAKPDTREDPGYNWIHFNRIALWTGDYEGAEFALTYRGDEVSMSDPVEEFLEHFGVKGMHWGVRRDDIKTHSDPISDVKTGTGSTMSFEPQGTPFLGRMIARVSAGFRDRLAKSDSYSLKNSENKKIGDLSLYQESPTSMNVVWVGVDKKERGKGYATAAMKGAIDHAKKKGLKQVTLEVPGNEASAKHIYTKLGFKDDGRYEGDADDVWGGLTGMTLTLDEAQHAEYEPPLEHFGTKGMKWGVRKDKGHEGERTKTKVIDALDQQFDERGGTLGTYMKIHNAAARSTNQNDIDRINNKPSYKDADFTRDSPLRRKYYREHQKAYLDNVEKAARDMGTNASGTKSYRIVELPGRDNLGLGTWRVEVTDVKHADISEDSSYVIKIRYDESGHVVSIEEAGDDLIQSSTTTEEFLAHFGIPGMKWGVRRNKALIEETVDRAKDAFKLGGADSKDKVVLRDLRRKAVKGGVRTLDDKELSQLVKRVELEAKYKKALKEEKEASRAFMKAIWDTVGKEVFSTLVKEGLKMKFGGGSRSRDPFRATVVDGNVIERATKILGK